MLIKLSLFLLVALVLSDFSDILTRGPEALRNMSEMPFKPNTWCLWEA